MFFISLIEHWHSKFLVLLSAETCSPLMWTTPPALATSLKFPHSEMYIERIPCILSFGVCHPAQQIVWFEMSLLQIMEYSNSIHIQAFQFLIDEEWTSLRMIYSISKELWSLN